MRNIGASMRSRPRPFILAIPLRHNERPIAFERDIALIEKMNHTRRQQQAVEAVELLSIIRRTTV